MQNTKRSNSLRKGEKNKEDLDKQAIDSIKGRLLQKYKPIYNLKANMVSKYIPTQKKASSST